MTELKWIEHIESIASGINTINRMFWYITVSHQNGRWVVYSGDAAILISDSQEAVDSFLYGMALAYSVIPENRFSQIVEEIKHEIE